MNTLREVVLAALVAMVISSPTHVKRAAKHAPHAPGYGHAPVVLHHGGGGYGKGQDYHHTPANYDFAYGVHDSYYGTNFGHSEARHGYNVKGQYYVHLPDGRIQKVSYYTDEYGYHPTVTYEGKAHFPSYGKGHGGGYH